MVSSFLNKVSLRYRFGGGFDWWFGDLNPLSFLRAERKLPFTTKPTIQPPIGGKLIILHLCCWAIAFLRATMS